MRSRCNHSGRSPRQEPSAVRGADRISRARLDIRLVPCAIAIWVTSGVVVWFRVGSTLRHITSPHAITVLILVCMAIAVIAIAIGARSWAQHVITALAGAAVGGVRSSLALRRADHHWLTTKQGSHLVIDDSMACTARSYARRLSDSPFAPGTHRYGVSVSIKGMPSEIFVSGGDALRSVRPGQHLEGVVAVKESFQPGLSSVTLSSVEQAGDNHGLHGLQTPGTGPRQLWDPRQLWAAFTDVISAVHHEFTVTSQRLVPEELRGLAQGMVIGDTSLQSDADKAAFVTSGLSHLSAVSGANVAIILGMVTAAVSTERPYVRHLCAALTVVGFVLLIGLDASVLRAAIAGSVGLMATMTGRRRHAVPALCCGIISLVLWKPDMALSLGFTLSCAATASIICVAPTIAAWIERYSLRIGDMFGRGETELSQRGRAVVTGIAVCVAAEVATQPIILLAVGRTSALSLVANLIVGGVVAPVTIVGTGGLGICALSVVVHEIGGHCGSFPLIGWICDTCCRGAGWLVSVAMAACTPVLWWVRGVSRFIAQCESAQLVVGSVCSSACVLGVGAVACILISILCGQRRGRCQKIFGTVVITVTAVWAAAAVVGGDSAGDRDRSGGFSAGIIPLHNDAGRTEPEYALRPPRDVFDHVRSVTSFSPRRLFLPGTWTTAICPFTPTVSAMMWPDGTYQIVTSTRSTPHLHDQERRRLQRRISDCGRELTVSSPRPISNDDRRRDERGGVLLVRSKEDIDISDDASVSSAVASSGDTRWIIVTEPSHSTTRKQFRPAQLADGTPVTTLSDEGIVVLRPHGRTCSFRFCP